MNNWLDESKLYRLASKTSLLSAVLLALNIVGCHSANDVEPKQTGISVKRIEVPRDTLAALTNYSLLVDSISVVYPEIEMDTIPEFVLRFNETLKVSATIDISDQSVIYWSDFSVGLVSNRNVSIRVNTSYYTYKAANGNSFIKTYLLDLKDGRLLGWDDVFKSDTLSLNELKHRLEGGLVANCPVYFKNELASPEFRPSFFVRQDSIEFVFSEYEISPGVCGSFSVPLSTEELEDLLLSPRFGS